MEKQSTSKLLRLMVAVFALFLLVITGSVLSACGGTSVAEHEHKYGTPAHTNPATCGATGYDVYTCEVCGDKYAVVTAASGAHDFKDGRCTVCGVSNGDDLKAILNEINSKVGTQTSVEAAHNHNFSTKVAEIKATCLTFGITVMKCECGSTSVTSLIEATGHTYVKANETGNRIPSTCTTNGQIEVKCSTCGDIYWEPNKDDMAPGHSFTVRNSEIAKEYDQAANCVSTARIAYKCERCDEIQYVNVGTQLGDHVFEDNWTNVVVPDAGDDDGDGDADADEDTIDENLDHYIDIEQVQQERKCKFCDAKETRSVAGEHTCNFQHTNTEFNRLKEVSHTVKGVDGEDDCTYTTYFHDPNCEEDGMENWLCVYKGCGKLENVAGQWVENEEAEEGEPEWIYQPSGSTDRKEVGDNGEKYEFRAKLNHGYSDNFKKDDGTYDAAATIVEITEIDRKEDGTVKTDKEQNGRAENNTSVWLGQTCQYCGKELAFKAGEDGKADLTAEFHIIKRNEDGSVDFNGEEYITRSWHTWVLYDEDGDSMVPEGSEVIEVPERPDDYKKNQPATCTEPGWEWYWCQDSHCVTLPRWAKVILPALGHDWEIDEETLATCTEKGELKLTCSRGCGASITITIENYEKVTQAEGWTWDRHTAKDDDFSSEEGKPEYLKEYLELWRLGIEVEEDDNVKAAIQKANKITYHDAVEDNEELTDEKTYTLTLEELLKKLIPTGHHWQEVEDSKVETDSCFAVPSKLYECKCEMENCCKEDPKKCGTWRDENPLQEHKKDANGNILTGVYYEYGECGTTRNSHKIYKVTYCKTCGLQLSREEAGENYRHFPFNRKDIVALYNTYIPENFDIEKAEVFVQTYGAEETARCMSAEAIKSRLEYAKVWQGIHEWWFENQTSSEREEDIRSYFYFKSGDKNDGGGFSLYCYDCFTNLYQYVGAHEPEATNHEMTATIHYYTKLENGAMVEISEDNKWTFDVCSNQYWLQYDVVCGCGMHYVGADPEGKWGAGQYVEQVQKDAEGNSVLPDGKHYLIPAKDYATRENYNLAENGTVTMDWICVFCGKTFELQVKYQAPEAASTIDEGETTDTSDIVLVNEDPNMILLVDTKGIKFDSELNEREEASKKTIFQMDGRWYYGPNAGWEKGYKTTDVGDISAQVTIVGGDEGYYCFNTTVLFAEGLNANQGYIVVGHRGPASVGSHYFEAGSDSNYYWRTEKGKIGSLLKLQNVVDSSNSEAYEEAWNANYSTTGLTDENDEEGTQRLAVAARLDDLLRAGGEIVAGGDLMNLTKKGDKSTSSHFTWDTVKTNARADEKIFPLATIDQTSGGVYYYHTKDDGEKCTGAGTTCTDGDSCTCPGCKSGEPSVCHCVLVPILYLEAGTTLDLNGHTLYGNIWLGTGAYDNKDNSGYGSDGSGSSIHKGEVTVKNGTIIMSNAGKIQLTESSAHLTLENVNLIGGINGIDAFDGASVTIKNSSVIADKYAITTNNCDKGGAGTAGQGSANFELKDSAFISRNDTAFYMPAKGNVLAEGCEFYGYNMGAFIRGNNLEEKAATDEGNDATHAKFVNCLFVKGDKSNGEASASATSSGTNTKHYGALTIGNDAKDNKGYGNINKLELRGCDFQIVTVTKHEEGSSSSAATDWTPGFETENKGDLNLGANNDDKAAHCTITSGDGECTEENCCHRAIVINIYGCSDNEDGNNCMTGDDECNEKCGGQNAANGKVHLVLDHVTLENLIKHAQLCMHKNTVGEGATNTLTNPFLGCTFSDGVSLQGKCKKLLIEVESAEGVVGQPDFNWRAPDATKPQA